MEKSCAFTGHRPKRFSFGYDEGGLAFQKLNSVLIGEIRKLVKMGVTTFYTGMALGVDQWAALNVLHLKDEYPVRLVAVRPCEEQANNWSTEQRYRYYDEILKHVDETILIQKPYTPDCMFKRNRYLVDHAAYLLAVHDGGARSGTGYTVQYAREQGRHIITIDPDSLDVTTPADIEAMERRYKFKIIHNDNSE